MMPPSVEPSPPTGEPGSNPAAHPIIFVIFQTGRHANGGVESISHIVHHLRGFRPIIVTQSETRMTKKWRDAGWEVHVWKGPDGFDDPRLVARARKLPSLVAFDVKMARLVRRTGARVVHCNDISSFWHAAPGAKIAGARVVFNIRSVFAPERAYGMKWIATRLIADQLLFISEEMRETLDRRMPSPSFNAGSAVTLPVPPIRRTAASGTIYSIVDLDRMRPVAPPERAAIRARLGMRPDEIAVGSLGAVRDIKNQLDFIERAAPALLQGARPVRIYFVGDFEPDRDPYARRCLDAVIRLGLEDSVRFAGFCEDVVDWYRALDAVFVVSRYEGLARCMIESLACGTPVASFDLCSAREILERHDCGAVVPHGDYVGMASALRAMIDDPTRRQALSTAAAASARALFDPERIAGAYEAVYARLSAPPVIPSSIGST